MKKAKWDLYFCILTGIITLILFVTIFHIYDYDLRVPFSYKGDALGVLQRIGIYVRGENLENVQSLGAPYGSNQYHVLWDAFFPDIFWIVFAKITKDAGLTINLYYILTYMLSAMCTFYMLRKLHISKITAMMGGIIYAFIPGHMLRGEAHITIGSCFTLPLIVLSVIYLCNGSLCKPDYQETDRLTMRETFFSIDKKMLFCVTSLVLTTFTSLYYGIFALFLISFAFVYNLIQQKKWRSFLYYGILCMTEFMCVVIIYLPVIISKELDPFYEPVNNIMRVMSGVEDYGLKLIQLILPVENHRLPVLANFAEIYNTNFAVNENKLSSLGLFMSAGFIISIFVILFRIFEKNEEIKLYSQLNLFIFCIATIGGGASAIAFINYNIRCYNRFSFYIGLLSVLVITTVYDLLWTYKKGKYQVICFYKGMLAGIIVCIAVFDQTTEDMVFSDNYYDAEAYYSEKEFVENIEQYEGDHANIFTLPYFCGMNAGKGVTADGKQTAYEPMYLSIHSKTSKWTIGSVLGEKGNLFLSNLSNHKPEKMIRIISAMGFDGIALNYSGFEENRLLEWKEILDTSLGAPVFENSIHTWAYYSLDEYTNKLKQNFTHEEWKHLEDICLDTDVIFNKTKGKNIYNTGGENNVGDATLISSGKAAYGPYTTQLPEGEYGVWIRGKNLENALFKCTAEHGGIEIEKSELTISETFVYYKIRLNEFTKDIEFVCINTTENDIQLDEVKYLRFVEDSSVYDLFQRLVE